MSTCSEVDLLDVTPRPGLCSGSHVFDYVDHGCSPGKRADIYTFRHRRLAGSEVSCDAPSCSGGTLDVIQYHNLRPEAFTNLYHAMEEAFALVQTAHTVGIDLRRAHLVFTGARHRMASHVRDLYAMLVANITIAWKGCANLVVLPLRACHGSALPVTWKAVRPCPIHRLTARVVSLVRPVAGVPTRSVALMTRRNARSRRLRDPQRISFCARRLNFSVHLHEDLGRHSLREQTSRIRNTGVLVAPHGAGLTQLLWLPNGAGVVELTPHLPSAQRGVANIYANMAAWSGHRYRAMGLHSFRDCRDFTDSLMAVTPT